MDLWEFRSGMSIVTASTYGMNGSYALKLLLFADYIRKSIAAISEVWCSVLVQFTSFGTYDNFIISLHSDSTLIGTIGCKATTGRLHVAVGSNPNTVTTYGTPGYTFNEDVTYLLEVRYNMADSGNVQVKVNGILVIDYSGDTKPGSELRLIRSDADFLGVHTIVLVLYR